VNSFIKKAKDSPGRDVAGFKRIGDILQEHPWQVERNMKIYRIRNQAAHRTESGVPK
jgi:hypothetical protein